MKIATIIATIAMTCINAAVAADGNQGVKSAEDELSRVAITYLERISGAGLDLANHTALSKHCGQARLKELREQIDFLRENGFRGNDKLSIETCKTDGHLASVLVRADNPISPLDIHIHAVALIKKEGSWLAAPLPGKFSNTGYGYDEKSEQSARSLERWMAREKVLRESRYRSEASSGIRPRLAAIEREAGFDKMSPQQTAGFFLEQCRNHNLLGIVASLGGGSASLAHNMGQIISGVSQGLRQRENPASDWSLLTSPSVVAQILEVNETSNEIIMGFYDPGNPNTSQASKIIRFPYHKISGRTYMQLPPSLQAPATGKAATKGNRTDRKHDYKLLRDLPTTIIRNIGSVSHETPEKLLKHFLDSVEKEDFTGCLQLVPRKGKFFGDGKNHKTILSDLAGMWRSVHPHPGDPFNPERRADPIIREKHLALVPLVDVDTDLAGEFEPIKLWMLRDEDGWHLVSPGTLYQAIDDADLATAEKIEQRLAASQQKRREERYRDLFGELIIIRPPFEFAAATEAEAMAVFKSFREQLRAWDLRAVLTSCTILEGTDHQQAIEAFKNAMRGAADHTDQDHILGTTRRGNWTGISVRTESRLSKTREYPLYLVANTEKGARILIDVDLRHASNKGRILLNRKSWDRLEEILPGKSLVALKDIFEEHLKLSDEDIKGDPEAKEQPQP